MPKMIALKKFRYPSGPDAKEHNPGDEIDVKTDRDAKALRSIRVARDAPPAEAPPTPPPAAERDNPKTLKPEPALTPKQQQPRPVEPMSTASMHAEPDASHAGPARRQRTYKRDDMTAEDTD